MWPQWALTILRSAAGAAAIAVITLVCAFAFRVNPITVGFLYLVVTLVIATGWGFTEAVVASVLATVCFNFFFLPPLHTFHIADSQNWVALFTFLGTSLLASRLSERAKRRTAEALSRQRDLEQLHAISRAILLSEGGQSLGQHLATEIARVYGAALVAIYERGTGDIFHAGTEEITHDVQQQLLDSAVHGGTFRDGLRPGVVTSFGLKGQTVGSLALAGTSVSAEALESLANLVAIGLEKARNQEAASRAEAARQTQEFKSTLLDALAHEFKTPLTSIQAAASAMLTPGAVAPEQHRELTNIIEQESDRLSSLVTEAIHLARIEAGKVSLNRQPCAVRDLVETAVRQLEPALAGRPLELSAPEDLPAVLVDRDLVELVLRQVMDNAVKYSPPQSPIRVRCSAAPPFVSISVWNDSDAIPRWEKTRLFEKFYRGSTAGAQSPGTGMGLAIVREIMAAHGGDVRVESHPVRGTEITVRLPACAGGAET